MILRPFKKIIELQEEINRLNEQIKELKNKNENDLRENHKTGLWCNNCQNLITEKVWGPLQGNYEVKFCKLDNACEDRKE